ncbi:981317d8-448e-46b5-b909-ca07e9776287 [Thermothielavioides terrestris]|jgi:hypothetical protein|uniref:SnoaL-like domain-containing protein n=2 Tax=Thermothielavioides terrestris TaxID=2587410 RepID=G2QZ89_THETT|nr:uncharacterized protein THITE_2114340 [Thermothielavioides terrestris NRRL 8126]AEO66325.1 hypothetical protein THITE_2114340 [Thermothielavioides terrestris NRRL 8126]SPQ25434.1 981317d8-448e-46b5-b909-ca07e9776287 [Thermothielavioides terrestris]
MSSPPSPAQTIPTNFASHAETYQAALRNLFAGDPATTEADLARLFTPDFTLEAANNTNSNNSNNNTNNSSSSSSGSNGKNDERYDFAGFVAHVRRLREWTRQGAVEVALETVQFLRDGAQLAERHVSTTTMTKTTAGTTTSSSSRGAADEEEEVVVVLRAETFQFAEVAEDGRVKWIREVVVRRE